MEHEELVRWTLHSRHVAVVTLCRPEARNAVNGRLARELHTIVGRAEDEPDVRVVVLASSGATFSAGADLKEIAAGRGEGLWTERGFAGITFADRSKPWIAAVEGAALAGGCEIVLACDLVVAAEGASFGVPEVTRGLVAAAGGVYRLPQQLPRRVALQMILTGLPIDAHAAHHHGLVNVLAPAGEALQEALRLAERIAANAPLAVRESLALARRAQTLSEVEAQAASRDARDHMRRTEDFIEGARAFAEKRAPLWKGR